MHRLLQRRCNEPEKEYCESFKRWSYPEFKTFDVSELLVNPECNRYERAIEARMAAEFSKIPQDARKAFVEKLIGRKVTDDQFFLYKPISSLKRYKIRPDIVIGGNRGLCLVCEIKTHGYEGLPTRRFDPEQFVKQQMLCDQFRRDGFNPIHVLITPGSCAEDVSYIENRKAGWLMSSNDSELLTVNVDVLRTKLSKHSLRQHMSLIQWRPIVHKTWKSVALDTFAAATLRKDPAILKFVASVSKISADASKFSLENERTILKKRNQEISD